MECSLKNLAFFDFDDLFNELHILLESVESIITYIQHSEMSDPRLYAALDGVKIILDRMKKVLNEESEDYAVFEKEFQDILSAKKCQEVKALIESMKKRQTENSPL